MSLPLENCKQRTLKSNKYLALCTFAWLVSNAALAFGPKFIWDHNTAVSILAIAANIATGFAMVMANVKLLQNIDELAKKVFLDAAAITLGVTVVFGVCYELASFAGGSFEFTARIAHIYFVIGPTFFISTLIGNWRYK